MYKKIISIVLILILSMISLTGCSGQNLDDLAYAIALGIDIGDSNKLKISVQIPTSSGSSSSSGSEQSTDYVVNTIECSSIDSGINLLNTSSNKQISLSHCKAVIVSESLAYQGVSDIIYTLMNKVEMSSGCKLIVCRGDTESFLNNSDPKLETVTSRYYDISNTSAKYSSFSDNITIGEFFSKLEDSFSQPYALLSGLNTSETQKEQTYNSETNIDGTVKANESIMNEGKKRIETLGLAVFVSDKLVGELNGIQTTCHLLVTNRLQNYTLSIPDPFNDGKTLDLYLEMRSDTKNSVDLVNGSPYVQCKVKVNARILSMGENSEYLTQENINILQEAIDLYLENAIYDYFYTTSREYKADIACLGQYMVRHFLTSDEWSEYNWLDNYQNCFFDVSVDSQVKSGYLLMET